MTATRARGVHGAADPSRRHRGEREAGLTFPGLVIHNVSIKKTRLLLAALAVAIGVMTVVTFSVVGTSLRDSALAIMQTGQADFTIAQKGVSDIVNSNINASTADEIRSYPGIAHVTGVLIATTRLDAANPQFLEIGIDPADLAEFGVTVVGGRAFGATAANEIMLGWRAADNLGAHVGDRIMLNEGLQTVVGIYSTGQALGDTGAMLPLLPFQTYQRQPAQLTLLFVQVDPGTNIPRLRSEIEQRNPQLVTIRTTSDFERADRSFALITAAERGSAILAVLVGAIVVMTTMTLTFVERTREFGVLSAIGWRGRRILTMVLGEALCIGLLGAAFGVVLSFAATEVLGQLPDLVGILHPDYTAGAFWRALYTAGAMSLLGGAYPALRASRLSPMEALRRE